MKIFAKARRVTLLVACLNVGYFGVEFFYALYAGSVSLIADSIDFMEDGLVGLLVFFAIMMSALWRRRVGMVLALLMAVPGVGALWAAWRLWHNQTPPLGEVITWVALGGLVVNILCTLLLVGLQKKANDNLIRALYLSNRNDVIISMLVMAVGVATLHYLSIWPDMVVGIVIVLLHGSAAWEVYEKSRQL